MDSVYTRIVIFDTGGLVAHLRSSSAPINTIAPAITGTEEVGQTLSVSNGTWDNSPTSFAYQWFRAVTVGGVPVTLNGLMVGVAIPGATSNTYLLDAADEGEYIFCEVTATNAFGSTMAQSNLTGAIASSEQPETAAWVAAVVGDGGTVSAGRETLVNDLITGLKADGVWSKLDRLWLFAAENSQSALRDLVAASAATLGSGSPAFSADDGYTGSATESDKKYIDTNFNPASAGGNYTQNSAMFGVWAITTGSGGANQQRHGWLDAGATKGSYISVHQTGGNTVAANINGAFDNTTTSATAAKFAAGNRSAAGAIEVYGDGAQLATNTTASTTLVGAGNFWVLGRNFVGNANPNQPSDEQVAACVIGGSLSSTDHGNLWSRLRTYMTAVGVP